MSKAVLQLTIMYAPAARQICEIHLALPEPCSALQALQQSGLPERFPELDLLQSQLGVWGRKVGGHHSLRDLDRLEVYRPLRVDPKLARRERFVKQGVRAAGLFANQRAGAKAGY